MDPDKMSTASSVGVARAPLLNALIFERRILFGCTVLVGLSSIVWIIAVCTSKWVHIEGGQGILLPKSNNLFLSSETGIWEMCRYVLVPVDQKSINNTSSNFQNVSSTQNIKKPNGTKSFVTKCTNFLAPPELVKDPAYDEDIANFVRTMVSFAIIGLFVMVMGCGFSVYTFTNPRYMFKRLAGGIHFISISVRLTDDLVKVERSRCFQAAQAQVFMLIIRKRIMSSRRLLVADMMIMINSYLVILCAACTFVVVQVTMSSVDHMKRNVKFVYPDGAYHYYNISFFLGWFVVLVNVFATLSFLWYSKKRKGDKAATDELAMADEPTIIGR